MPENCFSTFPPGLLTGGDSVKARAFTREAFPRWVQPIGIDCFSFVISSAALGRAMEVTYFVGLPLPSPNAGISSVSSRYFEE